MSDTQTCCRCKKTLPATPQYFRRAKALPSGLRPECKVCRGSKRGYVETRPIGNRYRDRYRSPLNLVTADRYEDMCKEQNNLCAICNRPSMAKRLGKTLRLDVDHEHGTGRVRGLLCRSCNTALGKFQDSIVILDAAIKYLKSWEI